MRQTHAVINLSNLTYNYLNLRKKAGNSRVMAVVKADAYGHGMLRAVDALRKLDKKPEYYGVALIEEAIELRKSKLIDEPILNFAPFAAEEFDLYRKYRIIPTISTSRHIAELKKISPGRRFEVHLNVDTGMGRLGIDYRNAAGSIEKLLGIKNVKLDGIYTHFATSDEKDKSYARIQLDRFNSVLEDCRVMGIDYGIAHAANSGAIIDMPDAVFDMVRPGISLYGYYPSLETSASVKLKPVMSVISAVSTLKSINKGDSVSYGRKFIAQNDTRVATVPIGYADGVPRALTNNIFGIIGGRYYKQAGRITMDRIMFEIGGADIKIGDRVILIGGKGKSEITAWDWSAKLGTIPYEITCNISKRVPRIYKD